MAVAVHIEGHPGMPGVETTFTEDVCSRGAKVYSARRWTAEEHLRISTLAGNFNCVARVAWCRPLRDAGFAIGLQFVEPTGNWVVASSVAS
jgi:hypothetical protein